MAAFALLWAAGSVTGQEIRGVGGVLGRVEARQIWKPPGSTDSRKGWAAGAFVDVAFPVPALGAQVEGLIVQRGTRLTVDGPDGPLGTSVESGYLSMPILLKLRAFRNPVGVSLVAGPMMELLLWTRSDPSLETVYGFERGSTLSLVAGGGVEVLVSGRGFVGMELRVVEGITSAYDAPSLDVRYRSVELLLRLGWRPGGPWPPQ